MLEFADPQRRSRTADARGGQRLTPDVLKLQFILIGGVAGNVHGAARATYDIDILYRRSADNLSRLVEALDLLRMSEEVPLFGLVCRCATLEALIRMKRAAGRPKDFEALAELEALHDERQRH